jgi:serine/threonine-protein kinase
VQAIVNGGFAKASKFRAGVPDELQQVLDRALAKSRDDRYPDCRAMQADLEKFILKQGETITQYQLSQLVQELSPVVQTPITNSSLIPSQASPTGLPTVALGPSGEVASSAATVRNLPEVVVSSSGEGKAVPVPPARSNFLPLLVVSLLIIVSGLVLLRQSTRSLTAPIPVPPEAIRVVEPPAPEPTIALQAPPTPGPVEVAAQPQPEPPPPPPPEVEPTPPPATPRPAVVTAPLKPKPRVPATPAVMGQVEFRVRPFGKVWVDGRLLGETPFDAVTLGAGKHQVRVQNRELGKDVNLAFEVKEGPNVFRYSFEE